MYLKLKLALLFFWFFGINYGQNTRDVNFVAKVDSIFSYYNNPMAPGAALGIYQNGEIQLMKFYGSSHLETNTSITSETVFNVGSVAKQFTAFAIALLAQQGKLSLDDDIRKFLPELPDYGASISLRQVIHHTSGLPDAFIALWLDGWRPTDLIKENDVLEMASRLEHLNFQPGKKFLYNTGSYILLSMVVERVSEMTFPEFTHKEIFLPLEMTSTFFSDDHSEVISNRAYGYSPTRDGQYRHTYTLNDFGGASSLYTTIEDFFKWDQNFSTFEVGGKELIELLQKPAVLNNGRTVPYGFGLTVENYKGKQIIGHSGGDGGFRADYLRLSNENLSIFLMGNHSNLPASTRSRQVADIFLQPNSLGTVSTEKNPEKEQKKDFKEDIELEKITGYYWDPKNKSLVEFFEKDNVLWMNTQGATVPLKQTGNFEFGIEGHPVEFYFHPNEQREKNNIIIYWRGKNGDQDQFLWRPSGSVSPEVLNKFEGTYASNELQTTWKIKSIDQNVVIERPKLGTIDLKPVFEDAFIGNTIAGQIIVVFDEGKKSFSISLDRIKNISFKKIE